MIVGLAKELLEEIKKAESIIIIRHRSPDLDAIGSQLGLKQIIQKNFNNKVYAVGEEGFSDFTYLGMVDEVKKKLYQKSLIIIVDTANQARIDGKYYMLGKKIIKIDHHPDVKNERYAQINIINDKLSSTCELLYHLIEIWKEQQEIVKLDENIARCLFCGIYGDTGGFVFPNTTSRTFEIVSKLTKYDFDYNKTMMFLRVYDYQLIKIVGIAYQQIKINENGVGYLVFDRKFQKDYQITPQKLSLVVNFFGIIKQLKVWVVFNQHETFIRVNIRSRSHYDISKIAQQFAGGGHKNASGAIIYSWEEQQKILNKLNELVE